MSKSLRRFEILLPRRFNDQRPIPEEWVIETILELERQFGAVSCESQVIHGYWQDEGKSYRDELVRLFVDVADSPENRLFFQQFKEHLKTRYKQVEIWVTTFLVEAL